MCNMQSILVYDGVVIVLKKNFRVFLHDPKFFVQRMDNFLVPFLDLDKPNGRNYRLIATTKKRMRRPGKFDCNPDDEYNFQVGYVKSYLLDIQLIHIAFTVIGMCSRKCCS